jgi:hypothetical protein
MDSKILKKFIKEAVREAIQEELKDILLEAVRSPKIPVGTGGYGQVTETVTSVEKTQPKTRSLYSEIMGNFKPGKEEISMNTSYAPTNTYVPSGVSAGIEGTLHPGELGLDQIMGLMNTK